MSRRIPLTKEERLARPRTVCKPGGVEVLGTIRHLDSGFWEYVRTDGKFGLAHTGNEAVQRLEASAE